MSLLLVLPLVILTLGAAERFDALRRDPTWPSGLFGGQSSWGTWMPFLTWAIATAFVLIAAVMVL